MRAVWKQELKPRTKGYFYRVIIIIHSWTRTLLTHWLPALFAKNAFLQQHNSLPFLPLALCFMMFWLGHMQKSKFGQENDLCLFFRFSFSPFLFVLLQSLAFYWACLQLKNFWESVIEMGKFYHGVAMCSGRNLLWVFHSTFWTFWCISWAPLGRSPWSGHHWKIFSSCRRWV